MVTGKDEVELVEEVLGIFAALKPKTLVRVLDDYLQHNSASSADMAKMCLVHQKCKDLVDRVDRTRWTFQDVDSHLNWSVGSMGKTYCCITVDEPSDEDDTLRIRALVPVTREVSRDRVDEVKHCF